MADSGPPDQRVDGTLPRTKIWRHPRLISEHAFDKLRLLDCTFAEFDIALGTADIIDERVVGPEEVKELLLLVDWTKALHVVVVVDDARREETGGDHLRAGPRPLVPGLP